MPWEDYTQLLDASEREWLRGLNVLILVFSSPGTGNQHPPLLLVRCGSCEGLPRDKDRLGPGRSRPTEEADNRQRTASRDRGCSKPNQRLAEV